MNKEVPQANNLINAFKEKVAQRKGHSSIESLAACPSDRTKKRSREVGNIATTTHSSGAMLTPPPPCHSPINIDSPLTDDFNRPIPPTVVKLTPQVSRSPLLVLGDDLQFSKGLKIGLIHSMQELIRVVPEDDLLQGSIEIICPWLVLSRMSADIRGH